MIYVFNVNGAIVKTCLTYACSVATHSSDKTRSIRPYFAVFRRCIWKIHDVSNQIHRIFSNTPKWGSPNLGGPFRCIFSNRCISEAMLARLSCLFGCLVRPKKLRTLCFPPISTFDNHKCRLLSHGTMDEPNSEESSYRRPEDTIRLTGSDPTRRLEAEYDLHGPAGSSAGPLPHHARG
jgi:hypothetical protein